MDGIRGLLFSSPQFYFANSYNHIINMPKRKRTTSASAKQEPIDRLDQAEELLIQLLQHTSDTTNYLETMLSGTTNGKDSSSSSTTIPTRQEQFSTKTLKLHNILTQEYRRLTGTSTAVKQSKHVLQTLDARLDKQELLFFPDAK